MATARQAVSSGWGVSPAVTAAATTDVLMRNTDIGRFAYYAITTTDVAPAFAVTDAHPLAPKNNDASERAVRLITGERLWIATVGATFDITVTTGAAG